MQLLNCSMLLPGGGGGIIGGPRVSGLLVLLALLAYPPPCPKPAWRNGGVVEPEGNSSTGQRRWLPSLTMMMAAAGTLVCVRCVRGPVCVLVRV